MMTLDTDGSFMAKELEAEDIELKEYSFTPNEIRLNGITVLDYTEVENDKVFLCNKKDILDKPRPSWIPELDSKGLAIDKFLPICVKDFSDGNYFVQSKIYTGEKDSNGKSIYKNQIYKMSPDVLAATVDYYLKRKRAELKTEGSSEKVSLPRGMNSMPTSRYNEISKLCLLCDVPSLKYKNVDKSITDKAFEMKGKSPGKLYQIQNNVVFLEQWQPLLENIKGKRLDMNYQKQDYIDSYSKAVETAYGDSKTFNNLYNDFGVKIKKQNGTNFSKPEIEKLSETLKKVYAHYGNLSELAGEYGLKISYADNCMQFARKAIGLYFSYHNAIGISFFNEEKQLSVAGINHLPDVTLAHEVAHWLDSQKGKESHNFFASDKYGSLENQIATKFKEEIKLREKSNKSATRIGKADEIHLGEYWHRTCECFARAMEQYYALKQGIDLSEEIAYARKDNFEEDFIPLIEELMEENKRHFGINDISHANNNEQKYIAKLMSNDSTVPVDFWRWSKNNVKDFQNEVIELLADTLPASKENLANFDKFVILKTEPDGTEVSTELEVMAGDFLIDISDKYKEKYHHFPYEDKYDCERWKFITDEQKKRIEKNYNRRVFTVVDSVLSAVDRAEFLADLKHYVNGDKKEKDKYKINDTLNKENLKPFRFIYEGYGFLGESIYESFVCKKSDDSGFKFLMVPHNADYYKDYDKLVVSENTYSDIEECQNALIDILVNQKENHDFKVEIETNQFYNIPEKYKQPLLSYIEKNEKEICDKTEKFFKTHPKFKKYEKMKDNIALYLIQEPDAVDWNSSEWLKKFEKIELSISNPLLANTIEVNKEKENKLMEKTTETKEMTQAEKDSQFLMETYGNPINGEAFFESEIEESLKADVEELFRQYDSGETEKNLTLVGVKMYRDPAKDGKISLLVEFDSKNPENRWREDSLFNALNEEGIEFNGMKVDFNPITKEKSGTIEQYLKQLEGFGNEEEVIKENARKLEEKEIENKLNDISNRLFEIDSDEQRILPFSIFENKEKGRVNIKFDTAKINRDILKELKAHGWKYAVSTKQWYPVGNAVKTASDFANRLQEKYSETRNPNMEKPMDLGPEKSPYDGIRFFDRNYNESEDFAKFFNSNIHLFKKGKESAITEEDAATILKAIGYEKDGIVEQRKLRVGLDNKDKIVILTSENGNVKTEKIELSDILEFAKNKAEERVIESKQMLQNYLGKEPVVKKDLQDIFISLYETCVTQSEEIDSKMKLLYDSFIGKKHEQVKVLYQRNSYRGWEISTDKDFKKSVYCRPFEQTDRSGYILMAGKEGKDGFWQEKFVREMLKSNNWSEREALIETLTTLASDKETCTSLGIKEPQSLNEFFSSLDKIIHVENDTDIKNELMESLLGPSEAHKVSKESTKELSVGDKLGEDTVSDLFWISDGVCQATLSREVNGVGSAQNYFVIDNSIINQLDEELKELVVSFDSKSVIENKSYEPYILKELIEKGLMPPRDDEFIQQLDEYISVHPLKYEKLKPVDYLNFERKLQEIAEVDKAFNKTPFELGQQLIALVDESDRERLNIWLRKQGCDSREHMAEVFDSWLNNKEQKKDIIPKKNNGYPPRGEQ